MNNLNAHLQKKPRFEQLSYKLEDGSAVSTQGVIIPGIIKSVSNNTRTMKNSKGTEYRIATVQTWNPSTETLETKSAQIIEASYELHYDSFMPESEVEVLLQFDEVLQKTYGKVQLPSIESFDFNSYASVAKGFQVEDQLVEQEEVA